MPLWLWDPLCKCQHREKRRHCLVVMQEQPLGVWGHRSGLFEPSVGLLQWEFKVTSVWPTQA